MIPKSIPVGLQTSTYFRDMSTLCWPSPQSSQTQLAQIEFLLPLCLIFLSQLLTEQKHKSEHPVLYPSHLINPQI